MGLSALGTAIGTGAGVGGGSALQYLSDILGAPGRLAWSGLHALGAEENPDEQIKAWGGDTNSLLGKIGSFGLGAVTDPLTYAGGALGGMAGKAGGKLLEAIMGGGKALPMGASVANAVSKPINAFSQLAEHQLPRAVADLANPALSRFMRG
jgi:hypothetical protein